MQNPSLSHRCKFRNFFIVITNIFLTITVYGQKHYYIFDKTLQYSDFKIIQYETTQRIFINDLLKYKKSDSTSSKGRKLEFRILLIDNSFLMDGYLIFLENIEIVESKTISDSNTYLISFYRGKYVKDDTTSVFVGIDDGVDQNKLHLIKIKYNKFTRSLEFLEGDIFLSKEFLIKID